MTISANENFAVPRAPVKTGFSLTHLPNLIGVLLLHMHGIVVHMIHILLPCGSPNCALAFLRMGVAM